ncbi:hypothetical protein [Cognatiluteimonas telluris]|uniref:hypothetical protein n=1 Tax=Cognatiluteimonas telluris TaxID=1104775 RepID=UPI0014084A74|nr:hypothetical protein [Lysobacter telluris]
MDFLGIAGIVIGLAIAAWEYVRAKKAEAELARVLHELPGQLVENITRFISQPLSNNPSEVHSQDNYSSAQYFDIDNDGRDELIVQFPAGAHGSAIQIYGFNGNQIHLRAETWSGTPCGFEIDTSDPTHSPLLRSVEISDASELPYVYGLRDVVWHRLENGELIEYKRQHPPQDEIDDRLRLAEQDRAGSG